MKPEFPMLEIEYFLESDMLETWELLSMFHSTVQPLINFPTLNNLEKMMDDLQSIDSALVEDEPYLIDVYCSIYGYEVY